MKLFVQYYSYTISDAESYFEVQETWMISTTLSLLVRYFETVAISISLGCVGVLLVLLVVEIPVSPPSLSLESLVAAEATRDRRPPIVAVVLMDTGFELLCISMGFTDALPTGTVSFACEILLSTLLLVLLLLLLLLLLPPPNILLGRPKLLFLEFPPSLLVVLL